jgi:hypothetical protein
MSVRLLVVSLAALAACRGAPEAAFTRLVEARRLAWDVHVQFVKAAGASDRAVLADTDAQSVQLANAARGYVRAADASLEILGADLEALGYADESRMLADFRTHFADYRKVDEEVLALAVENTNLKAQRLAFGPVREAADTFKEQLGIAAPTSAGRDRARVDAAVAEAVLAVREIQVLQAPHIAEADAAAMTRLEDEMSRREQRARAALATLRASLPSAAPTLAAATTSLDRFHERSAELVALSRENTNVRSLALALRPKAALTAACDASLTTLEEALAKRGFTGTR